MSEIGERKQKGNRAGDLVVILNNLIVNFKSAVNHCFVFPSCLGMTLPRVSGRWDASVP
jgi:hypothetical protein